MTLKTETIVAETAPNITAEEAANKLYPQKDLLDFIQVHDYLS